MKRLKQRILLLFGVLAVSLLAACSSGEEGGEPPEEWVAWQTREAERAAEGIEETPLDENAVLAAGIYVDELYIGERTVAEARTLLEEYQSERGSMQITLRWEENTYNTTPNALGLSWDIDGLLKRAVCLGELGGPLRQYRDQQDLQYGTLKLEPEKSLDEEKLAEFVASVAEENDVDPVDATIRYTGTSLEVSQSETGLATNQTETASLIRETALESYGNVTLDAVVEVAQPHYTTEALQQIQTPYIGHGITRYRAESRTTRSDRDTNVEVATAYINGTVLLPGESVSTSELMRERTEENGYRKGTQYNNGEVEDAIGGGICQVSTTLYLALLRAEIQVDERYPHSMEVDYVDPGKDAAISEGYKDLCFTNNKDFPIYIWGDADGYLVTFYIFGQETRPDNREIEFETVELYRNEPETVVEEDPTIPPEDSYSVAGSPEMEVELWKIVKVDGVETERIKLHTDYYAPRAARQVIGTG